MEEVQADVAALDRTATGAASIGVVRRDPGAGPSAPGVPDDLQTTLQDLFTRYGGAEGDAFKLAVACYPKGDDTMTEPMTIRARVRRARSRPCTGADRPDGAAGLARRARRGRPAGPVRVLGPLHARRRRAAPAPAARRRQHPAFRLAARRRGDHRRDRLGRGRADGRRIVTLSQTPLRLAGGAWPRPTIRGVLQTFWALALANLVDYVEGRELTPKVRLHLRRAARRGR